MLPKILTHPDPKLREKSTSVVDLAAAGKLAEEMFAALYDAGNGAGLAAIQVGVPLRIFVMDLCHEAGQEVLINPTIVDFVGEPEPVQEGCLSLPGIVEEVPRHPHVLVSYTALDGSACLMDTRTSPGSDAKRRLRAQVVQHEVEHFDGFLLIDRMPRKKREQAVKKLNSRRQ